MRRREFIAGLGSAAAWPVVGRAQQAERLRRLGIFYPSDPKGAVGRTYIPLITQGLEELGWINNRNLHVDIRWAAGDVDRLPPLARELVDLQLDVIIAISAAATRAVQAQTRTIPIVFAFAGDPIASGILTNVARPEGNTTGVTDLFPSIGGKWLELLKGAKPNLATVALVYNPGFLNGAMLATQAAIEEAAERYLVKVMRVVVREVSEIAPALDAFAAERNGAVIPLPTTIQLPGAFELINQAALRRRLPTIYHSRVYPADGALMSYGADIVDLFRRRAADYINRILRGAKPIELPVQFPTKFEFVINLKTANAIGLTVPPSLLVRADEVIE
jgi:putative tryptophan/tyrosine transport system substrate-binding protein